MKIANEEKEKFIKVENEFITEGHEKHLNDKELYLYSLLYMDRRIDGTVITNLSTISDFMNIRFASSDQRNVKAIKLAFHGLVKLDILSASNKVGEIIEVDNLKASDSFRVVFKEVESKGHVQIPHSKYEACKSLQDYYIVCAVKRWENTENGIFKCNMERFARILGVARSTAQRNIDDAVELKLIFRNIGDYTDNANGGQKMQDLNEYKCIPFNEKEKSTQTRKKEHEDKFSSDDVYDDCNYDEDSIDYYFHNWNRFEEEDNYGQMVSCMPDVEDHKFIMEVEKNIENRKPTEKEYELLDKAQWRSNLILNSYAEAIGQFNNIHQIAIVEFEEEQEELL